MCRLLVYFSEESCPILLADLLIRPSHSIIKQSYDARERHEGPMPSLNGDGFGIGWFPTVGFQEMIENVEKKREERRTMAAATRNEKSGRINEAKTPCIFTGITPAWNNMNLHRISENVSSHLIFGHVRAASPGYPTNEANCHPFLYKNFMFMHNGCVGGFSRIRRKVLSRLNDKLFLALIGNTDSEHCFLLFMQILFEKYGEDREEYTVTELKTAMNLMINTICGYIKEAGVKDASLLNFAITDGMSVVVSRSSNCSQKEGCSMYYASGASFDRIQGDTYGMLHSGRREVCHIISSEPLAQNVDSVDWVPVPNNYMIVIPPSRNLLLCKLDPDLK